MPWLPLLLQTLTLTGPALVAPGGPVELSLTLDPQGKEISALQWGVSGAVVSDVSSSVAAKQVSWHGQNALVSGLNRLPLPSGEIARVRIYPSSSSSSAVSLLDLVASSPDGQRVPLLAGPQHSLRLRPWSVGNLAVRTQRGGADMAIVQTGSVLQFNISTDNSGTVSSAITVPDDAQLVLVGVSGYHSVSNYFSGGSMTFTKGGVDTAMTPWITGAGAGDYSTSYYMAAGFYLVLPDTGANKTLKWDWAGTQNATTAPIVSVTFWKGINTSSPVRAQGGVQNTGLPYTISDLAAQSGDKVVAFVGCYVGGIEGSIDSWSNLTEIAELTYYSSGDGAWAAGDPSGTVAVAASTGTDIGDGGMVAIVLRPAEGGLSQSAFRWRMDDGNESSATWAAAENAAITAPASAARRVRIQADSGVSGSMQFALEYRKSTDQLWRPVKVTEEGIQ